MTGKRSVNYTHYSQFAIKVKGAHNEWLLKQNGFWSEITIFWLKAHSPDPKRQKYIFELAPYAY